MGIGFEHWYQVLWVPEDYLPTIPYVLKLIANLISKLLTTVYFFRILLQCLRVVVE